MTGLRTLAAALLSVLALGAAGASLGGDTAPSGEEPQLAVGTPPPVPVPSGGGGGTPLDDPFLPIAVVVAGVCLIGVAYAFRGVFDRGGPDAVEEGAADPGVAALGSIAGAAADRIENSSEAENEVYRAWAAMVDHLAVDRPEATTPGEFADAAVDAGMAREDVTALTELFEEVRYGERDPGARAELAVDTLRRIEERYAGES